MPTTTSAHVLPQEVTEATEPQMRPVIITGLSGGGLSTAAKVFEDKGFFVSQNLPPQLILELVDLAAADDSPVDRLAVVTDAVSYTHLTLPTNREV